MNTPFLTQVAAHYAGSATLHDTLFVLPNRRSTKQFERALAQQLTTTSIMPRLMSMNDFVDHVTRGSNLVIAPPIENLFVAYGAYKEVMGENAGEFDKFAYWGQLIVSDFNDVDMNLVDASSLYTNLSNLREISANYIDDELKQAISRIFNINLNDGADKFWKSNGNEVHEKYVTLWNRLAAIYDKYGEMLAGYHLTTQGKLYRMAAQALEHMDAADLGFSLVVMVGHDMLSMSEMRMFKLLQKKGLAHFWWDDASPAFVSDANPAARVIKALSQAFKAPAQLEPIDNLPAVTVQSVPSTMGQAKCAFEGLTALTADTAIVLPDESMLEPLLHSLPDELLSQDGGTVNVTMGYQLRQSNVVTLMRLVTIAHHHAVRKADRWYFYREDVRNILSHPIIKMAFTATVLAVNNAIEEQNEYNIPASMFSGTGLEPLFTAFGTQPQAVGDNMGLAPLKASADVMSFVDGLERFCDTLYDRVSVVMNVNDNVNDNGIDDDNDEYTTLSLQCAFIRQYTGVLRQLRLAIDKIGLPVGNATIFHLIDRMTGGVIVPFEGRSGEGLQVMGMLETRCLDFDDLRILSVNEGVLPKGDTIQSLIPSRFRAAFGMPTSASNDAALAYRFYRLISRASHVTLYYDASDAGKSVPSRYIEQLDKVYNCDVTRIKRKATVVSMPQLPIAVSKRDLGICAKYTAGDDLYKDTWASCLSASSINEYINCQLMFYLHHIAGLNSDNDVTDFMDASTFGTIVHDTLQHLYYPDVPEGAKRQKVFTADDIRAFKKERLDTLLRRNINRVYMKRPPERHDDALEGQAVLLFETLKAYVSNALKLDIEKGSLEIVECEETHRIKMKVGDVVFNLTYKADRIDRVGDTLRMIDYKTGSDPTSYKKITELGDVSKDHRPKAILQLLLYTMAYVQEYGDKLKADGIKTITPIIYKLRAPEESGAKCGENQIELTLDNFMDNDVIKAFVPVMSQIAGELLDDNVQFVQQDETDKSCRYCAFTDFCRR